MKRIYTPHEKLKAALRRKPQPRIVSAAEYKEMLPRGYELAYAPDPSAFDPGREPEWTLAMVASWAVHRTMDAVRDVSEAWRVECLAWFPHCIIGRRSDEPAWLSKVAPTRHYYTLASPPRQSPFDVFANAIRLYDPSSLAMDPLEARSLLVSNLKDGCLSRQACVQAKVMPRQSPQVLGGTSPCKKIMPYRQTPLPDQAT